MTKTAILFLTLAMTGCSAPGGSTSSGWTISDYQVSTPGTKFAIPGLTKWKGVFKTNIFELRVAAPGLAGYIVDVTNRTRFPILFIWTRSVLVDSHGWTHPIVYPNSRMPGVTQRSTEIPIIIAPFAKRRILLVSAALYARSDQLPFKPEAGEFPGFRPKAPDGTLELEESVVLTFQYREEDLEYRFGFTLTNELKGDGASNDRE